MNVGIFISIGKRPLLPGNAPQYASFELNKQIGAEGRGATASTSRCP